MVPDPTALLTRRIVLLYVGLIVLASLPYLNGATNEFVYDDRAQVVRNELVRSLDPVPVLAAGSVTLGHVEWYRPLTIYTFALNHAASGLNPFPYHLTNIAVHVANTCLLLAVGLRLFKPAMAALVAAALFAVHSVHTEAVTPVFGRADLLACFFVLLGWRLALRSRPASRWWAGAGVAAAFGSGLLAKESAIALLPVIALSDLLWQEIPTTPFAVRIRLVLAQRHSVYAALLLALAAYGVLRYAMLGGLTPPGVTTRYIENPLVEATVPSRVVTAFWVSLRYVWLFLVPIPLTADYSYAEITLVKSWTDPRLAVVLIALCGVAATATWVRHRVPGAGGALALFVILLAPVSNVPVRIGTIMAERLLYLPSAALCLLAGVLVARLAAGLRPWRTAGAIVLAGMMLGGNVWLTVRRNEEWRSEETLFAATVVTSAHSAKARFNHGSIMLEMGRSEEAEASLRAAVRIAPAYPEAQNALGTILLARGDLASAEQAFRAALHDGPDYAPALGNLGIVLHRLGRLAEAEEMLTQAVAGDGTMAVAYVNLGLLAERRGDIKEAISCYRRAYALDLSLEVARARAEVLAANVPK